MERLLPSFLDWGPWLWRGIALGTGVVGVVLVVAIRYLRARARGTQAGRATRTDPGAVRGVLRGATPGALAQQIEIDGYDRSAQQLTAGTAEWRAPEVWLDTGDRRIRLVGPLRVVAGARFEGRRGTLPRLSTEVREAIHAQLPWVKQAPRSTLVITLADGDEVAVRGLPQPEPGRGEATAREADIAWSLEGTAEAPLELAAIRTQAPRLPLGIIRGALVLGLVAGVTMLAIRSHARTWEDACRVLVSADPPRSQQARSVDEPLAPITGDHPCILAATVFGDRDEAVSNIYQLLNRHPYRDPEVFEALLDVRRESHGYRARCSHVDELYAGGLYEVALREAQLCGDRTYEHLSLVALGRLEEAIAVETPGDYYLGQLPTIATLIATRRWREAAERVDARIANADADELPRMQCFAELLRHHAGDAGAVARLRELTTAEEAKSAKEAKEWMADPELATSYTANPCSAVLALVDPAARQRWLARSSDAGSWATDLLRSAAGHATRPSAIEFENTLAGSGSLAIAWLPIDVAPSDPPVQRLAVLRQRAVRAVLDGDPAAAKRAADDAVALAAKATDHKVIWDVYGAVQDLPDLVSLYTPRIFPDRPRKQPECRSDQLDETYFRCTNLGRAYERSPALEILQLRTPEPIRSDRRGYARFDEVKQTGDGRALLGQLRPGGDLYWQDLDLLAILPHIKTHRASIARELPFWGAPSDHGDLFVAARSAVVRRTLFAQLDRPAEAARWHATYRRFAEVFEDRDRLIALLLNESIR